MNIPGVEYMDAQPLVFARPQNVRVSRKQLRQAFNSYVERYAAENKLTYNQAFDEIRKQDPELFQTWANNK